MAEANSQVAELKKYLKVIIEKQKDLQTMLDEKRKRAAAAKRMTTGESIRSLQGSSAQSDNPVMVKRMNAYIEEVESLEKELRETNQLVDQVVGALQAVGLSL